MKDPGFIILCIFLSLFCFGVVFLFGAIQASSSISNNIIRVCATKGEVNVDNIVIKCEIQKDTK